MIPHTFFLRIQRGPTISSGVKAVQIVPQQLFAPEEYYVWLVDPNPIRQLVLAIGMVAVVLAGVMFPLWPIKMRIGVWYLSVGVLGLVAAFFGLAIVRLVVWLVTKVAARPGIWIFPNLFADVGFVRRRSWPRDSRASEGLTLHPSTGRLVHPAVGMGRSPSEKEKVLLVEKVGGRNRKWRGQFAAKSEREKVVVEKIARPRGRVADRRGDRRAGSDSPFGSEDRRDPRRRRR